MRRERMLRKVYENRKLMINCAFFLYIIGVLVLTFVVRETMVLRTPKNRGVVLEPFREFQAMIEQHDHFFWFKQIMLNILLFIPLGFLLPLVYGKVFRDPVLTVLTGYLFSASIESMQYITGRGLTEIDDVITNTVGTAAGYVMFVLVMRLCRRKQQQA